MMHPSPEPADRRRAGARTGQGATRRSLAETIEAGWRLLDRLPSDDLLKLNAEILSARARQRREAGGAA
jgi:hypothetical protein